MSTQAVEFEKPPAASGRGVAVAAAASIFGWGLDLFDLFLLLYVAPVVGKLFFPAGQPMLSLAGAYISFSVALLVRPIGSAIFGSYADRNGRRKAMLVAVIGVGISTAVFGLLPTVAQIGWAASVIFLLFRLVQGIFVGGVIASTHTIGTEAVPERWRGLMSGAVGGGGSSIGGFLASSVFFIVSTIAPGPAFAEWGWRLMFFSGLLSSVVGIFLSRSLEESPAFQRLQQEKKLRKQQIGIVESPLKTLMSAKYRGVFVLNLLLSFGAGAGYYLTTGYLPSFFAIVNKVPNSTASLMLIAVSFAGITAAMFTGNLSQRIGRRPVFVVMGAVRIFAYPALFLAMARTDSFVLLALAGATLSFITNASYGPLQIFLNERFPTALRASGTGLSWNIGFAIGGTLPALVPLVSGSAAGLPTALAIFSCVVSVIFFGAALVVPETRGNLDRY